MPYSSGGGVGSTVEIAEIETLADGTIIVGDGSGAPTTLAAFTSSTGTLKSANGGTANAFFTVSGPATSTKTYTFPNASVSIADLTTAQALTNKDLTATSNSFTAASTTQSGVAEASIASEVNTGTDAARYVSPDSLAGSNLGTMVLEMVAFDFTTDTATGDGKAYAIVPACMAGMDLVAVNARVITAGTTNTTDIQIANVTQAADMLTTKMTIDSTETSTTTAATAPVIDTNNDDVAAYDLLRVDVDAVSTTAAKGLIITLEFRLP